MELTEILRRYELMQAEYERARSDLRRIADLFWPSEAEVIGGTEPASVWTALAPAVYDSIGFLASTKLGGSLLASIQPVGQRYLTFEGRPPAVNEDNAAQNWMEYAADLLHRYLDDSNDGQESGALYRRISTFGTGFNLMEEREPLPSGQFGGFRFTPLQTGTYWIAENADGEVDTLCRMLTLPAGAAARKWGRALGDQLSLVADRDPYKMIQLHQYIAPRERHGGRLAPATRMPWASYLFSREHKHLIAESGYPFFPAIGCRWERGTGVWGIGQGHKALPDVASINRAVELRYYEWEKRLNPPTYEAVSAVVGRHIIDPGARNYTRGDPRQAVWTVPLTQAVQEALQQEDRLTQKIREQFFLNEIEALPPMSQKPGGISPFELAERMAQVWRTLGSPYSNVQSGVLKNKVMNGLWVLWRAGMLPDPPPALQGAGVELDVKFQGLIVRSQQGERLSGIEQFLMGLAQDFQVRQDPGIWDLVDLDRLHLTRARILGVPASTLRGMDVVARLRAQRAQQQEIAAQLAQAEQAGKAARGFAPMAREIREGMRPEEAA